MVKIVVTQNMNFFPDQVKRLKSFGEVKFYDTMANSADEWLRRVDEGDIICTGKFWMKDKVNEVKNKFFALPFVGVSYVDLVKIKENNTFVSYCPGGNKYAVSEWIVGMMFQLFRGLNYWTNMKEEILPESGIGLFDKKVVILGKGNIGSRVGIMCEAIGMKVDFFLRGDNLYEKVKDADVVVDCLSLNPSTKSLLDENFFNSMKSSAFFITVTGPEICDVDVMIKALNKGKLAGVAHDAANIQNGDIKNVIYQKLLAHPKILVTPHISYNTDVTKRLANDMMIDNIEAWIKGKPQNLVE